MAVVLDWYNDNSCWISLPWWCQFGEYQCFEENVRAVMSVSHSRRIGIWLQSGGKEGEGALNVWKWIVFYRRSFFPSDCNCKESDFTAFLVNSCRTHFTKTSMLPRYSGNSACYSECQFVKVHQRCWLCEWILRSLRSGITSSRAKLAFYRLCLSHLELGQKKLWICLRYVWIRYNLHVLGRAWRYIVRNLSKL